MKTDVNLLQLLQYLKTWQSMFRTDMMALEILANQIKSIRTKHFKAVFYYKPVRLKQINPVQFCCTQHSTPCLCDLKLTNIKCVQVYDEIISCKCSYE